MKPSEQEIGAKAVAWLQDRGWDVYQEVETGNGRPDIVGVREPATCIIECKVAFGISVIEQAARWVHRVSFVWIASGVPSGFGLKICGMFGIGVLGIEENVHEIKHPEFQHVINIYSKGQKYDIRRYLNQKQKTCLPAGSCGGGYYTEFKETVEQLKTAIRNTPGIKMMDAIKEIKHHYRTDSTARVNIYQRIRQHIVKGIRIENGKLYLEE